MDIIHKAYCYFDIISQRQNSLRNKFLLRHNIKKGCPAGQPHKNIGTFGYFFAKIADSINYPIEAKFTKKRNAKTSKIRR